MNFKSQIAPKGLQFNSNDFIISDKYATVLTAISYPRIVDDGYLSDLTNIPGVKVSIKHIPVPFSMLRKMLDKELADLRAKYQQEREKVMTTQQKCILQTPRDILTVFTENE